MVFSEMVVKGCLILGEVSCKKTSFTLFLLSSDA